MGEKPGAAELLDALPSLVAYVDRQGRNQYANRAAQHWLGRTPEQARGVHVSEIVGPQQWEVLRPRVEGALAGTAQQFERLWVQPDGSVSHGLTEYVPRARDGEPDGFYVWVTDITRRVEAEAASHDVLVASVLAEERMRVAARLSDTVLQQLFAAGLALQQLPDDDPVTGPAVRSATDHLQSAVEGLRVAVRGLATGQGLRGPATNAIRRIVAERCEALLVAATVTTHESLADLDTPATQALLHALSRLLGSLAHQPGIASAEVTVSVDDQTGELVLRVVDDAPAPVSPDRLDDWDVLRSRSAAYGARLSHEPRHPGTAVEWRCPLDLGRRSLRVVR